MSREEQLCTVRNYSILTVTLWERAKYLKETQRINKYIWSDEFGLFAVAFFFKDSFTPKWNIWALGMLLTSLDKMQGVKERWPSVLLTHCTPMSPSGLLNLGLMGPHKTWVGCDPSLGPAFLFHVLCLFHSFFTCSTLALLWWEN